MSLQRTLVLLLLVSVVPDAFAQCQNPVNAEQSFSCTANDIQYLRLLDPQTWWQIYGPSNGPGKYQPALDFVRNYLVCCRICVWAMEYPVIDPMVALSGQELDCLKFREDFASADGNKNGELTRSEFAAYMESGPNLFLVENNLLDANHTFKQSDLNRDQILSLEEYMVLRHFWAIAHTTRTGPMEKNADAGSFGEGALGGLFVDKLMLRVWYTVVVGQSLELYMDNFWDTSSVREPTPTELDNSLRLMDMDGSGKVSLEEHYFRVFADRNNDGFVSKAEYYQSLYSNCHPNSQASSSDSSHGACRIYDKETNQMENGGRDSPYLFSYNFQLHDINRDGRVSFLERKFFAADTNVDLRITEDEFMRGDYLERPGNFGDHARAGPEESEISIDFSRYLHYQHLHDCASLGALEYGVDLSKHPWSRTCVVDLHLAHVPPFVSIQVDHRPPCLKPPCSSRVHDANASSQCSSDADCAEFRACSYFGFCHNLTDLQPLGPFKRHLALIEKPSGYAFAVWEEIAEREQWNYTLSPSRLTSLDGFEVSAADKIFSLATLGAPEIPQTAGWCCDYDFELKRCRVKCPSSHQYEAENKPSTPIGLFSAFKHSRFNPDATTRLESSGYICSENLWRDSFIILVPASLSATSYQIAMITVLVSPVVAPSFYSFLAANFFITLLAAHIIWGFERGGDFFRSNYFEGIWDGIWFCFVTESTVGYGDKAPQTWFGRLCASVWIILSLILFSVLLSEVVGSMETEREKSMIVDAEGLQNKRVGVLQWTQPSLLEKQFKFSAFVCGSMLECLNKLNGGFVDALLVPGSDAAVFVTSPDFAEVETSAGCPSPIKVVGEPVLRVDAQTRVQNTFCMCRTCSPLGQDAQYNNAYLARYLMDAVAGNLETLAKEGVLDNLAEDYLKEFEVATKTTCSQETLFNVTEISICLATIVFFFVARRAVLFAPTAKKINAFQQWLGDAWERFKLVSGITHPPRQDLTEEEQANPEVSLRLDQSTQEGRYEQLDRYFKHFARSRHAQVKDVDSLQEGLVKSRVAVTDFVTLVMANLGIVLGTFVLTVTALMVVWGTQVPLDKMGTFPGMEAQSSPDVKF